MRNVIIALLTVFLLGNASAAIMVTDVNIEGQLAGGAGFITSDVNIVFTVEDTNAELKDRTTYVADITYDSVKGETDGAIVTDYNLGTSSDNAGRCDANVGLSQVRCEYSWTNAAVGAISDGNYFIDVNVQAFFDYDGTPLDTDANLVADFNMDSNNSFYIDNTTPSCIIDKQKGNKFVWEVDGEGSSEAVGSTSTIYYSIDIIGKDPTYSTATGTTFEDNYDIGDLEYNCYITDSAGNTSSITSEEIEYPVEGAAVHIGAGTLAGQAPGSLAQSIAIPTSVSEINFASPLGIGVILVVVYLLFVRKTKKGGKKK